MGERLVIVGNGMVGGALRGAADRPGARPLRRRGRRRGAAPAYNRVLLSSLLAGEVEERDLDAEAEPWWRRTRRHDCASAAGRRDRHGRSARVSLADGTILPSTSSCFATGSQPIRLPKPGMDLPGVITFRDLADIVDASGTRAARGRRVPS